jgi:ferredoxin
MRVEVDWNRCTGNGICESYAPDVFEVQDSGDMELLNATPGEDEREGVEAAVAGCPTESLSIVEHE